jgi:hypothetical protein
MTSRAASWLGRARFWLPIVAGVTFVIWAVVTLWFVEREPSFDEQVLFNPIYLFLETGHMAYPVYSTANSDTEMFVHPPTHYFVVAVVMWLTRLPVMAAAIVPVLLWLSIAALVLVTARFTAAAKLALLVGLASIVIWPDPFFIRPDIHVAAAWLAGLIVLESGRVSGWDPLRLALGAFLLALASALHYPASASAAGILVYAVWVVRDRGWRNARLPLAGMATAALLVLGPYVLRFVIPFRNDIRAFAALATPESSGILGPFRQHVDVYRQIWDTESAYYQAYLGNAPAGELLHFVSAPFTWTGIPVVVFTTLVFFARRETRGIALASLPYLLFLLFFARWTGPPGFRGYFIQEFALYFAAVAYLVLLGLRAALQRLPITMVRRDAAWAVCGATLLFVVLLMTDPAINRYGERTWHPLHRDMEIARAATGLTLPRASSLVSNQANIWFTAGTTSYYPLWKDVWYAPDVSDLNVMGFLRGFTAVGESEQGTWISYNKQRETIATLWRDGKLNLWRFYFGARRAGGSLTEIRFVLLTARKQPIVGNAFDGRRVYRFHEDPGGDWMLASAMCPVLGKAVQTLTMPWRTITWLPGLTNSDPVADAKAGRKRYVIHTWIEPTAGYESLHRRPIESECTLLMRARMRATIYRPEEILNRWERTPEGKAVISFPKVSPAVNQLYAPPTATRAVPGAVRLGRINVNGLATVRRRRGGLLIETPSARYAYALQVPLRIGSTRDQWIRIKGHVAQGTIGICILDVVRYSCITRRSLPANASGAFYLRIPPAAGRYRLYFDNQQDGASRMSISELAVMAAERRSRA